MLDQIDFHGMTAEELAGEKAAIPAQFYVSEKSDEKTIRTGLVIIGTDGSEFVWIPME